MFQGPRAEFTPNKVSALVRFDENGPVPLAIKIDGGRIDIGRITYRWVTHRGAYPIYHYSAVLPGGEMAEILFDSEKMQWKISALQEI